MVGGHAGLDGQSSHSAEEQEKRQVMGPDSVCVCAGVCRVGGEGERTLAGEEWNERRRGRPTRGISTVFFHRGTGAGDVSIFPSHLQTSLAMGPSPQKDSRPRQAATARGNQGLPRSFPCWWRLQPRDSQPLLIRSCVTLERKRHGDEDAPCNSQVTGSGIVGLLSHFSLPAKEYDKSQLCNGVETYRHREPGFSRARH